MNPPASADLTASKRIESYCREIDQASGHECAIEEYGLPDCATV